MKNILNGFWFGTTAEAFEGELPLYKVSTVCACCSEHVSDNVREDEELTCNECFNLLGLPSEFGELVPPSETAKEAFKRIQTDFIKFDIEQAKELGYQYSTNFTYLDGTNKKLNNRDLANKKFKSLYDY
jgi:hypothetical protein